MKNKKNLIIAILLVALFFVIALLVMHRYTNVISNSNVKEFLVVEHLISSSDVVGSNYPGGYLFNGDGSFAYYDGDGYPVSQNHKISFRGIWSVSNGVLTLSVSEEELAIGGRIEQNEIYGDILVGYSREVRKVDYKIEYKINYIKTNEEHSRTYMSLDDGTNLYKLIVEDEYINILKVLSTEGYDLYYNELDKYYNS